MPSGHVRTTREGEPNGRHTHATTRQHISSTPGVDHNLAAICNDTMCPCCSVPGGARWPLHGARP